MKNHMIISTDPEKLFDETAHSFMIKTLINLDLQGILVSIIKATGNIPTSIIMLNGKKKMVPNPESNKDAHFY